MSMKSHRYSMPPSGGSKKHHDGHAHGHPTERGHGDDSGTMAEYGLSEGNSKGMKSNKPEEFTTQPETHKLQHVDYGEITGM